MEIQICDAGLGLPNKWLNTDFTKTKSYSSKLMEVSAYYRTYSNILMVRTISAEYLIAMKLMSGRKYKHDLSDIAGILLEHQQCGFPITKGAVDQAVRTLYGNWSAISTNSKLFIKEAFSNGDYVGLYQLNRENEALAKEMLIEFEKDHPNQLCENNIDEVLEQARQRLKNDTGTR